MAKNIKGPSNNFKKRLRNNFITRLFRTVGSLIDLLFSKNITLIMISVITASILYVYVIDLPSQLELKNLETRTLNDSPVEIVNKDKAKVIEIYDQDGTQIDDEDILADVIIKGPRNEVLKMVNNKDYKFFIDTTSVKDGESKDMELSVDNKPENVIVTSSPSTFKVVAHKRVVRDDLSLQVEAVNVDKMGSNLTVESIELASADAQVSGSSEKVDSVATIKALVNVESIKAAGSVTLTDKNVVYRAYNSVGDTVDVDVEVKDKSATVKVDDYGKEVPIVIKFTGKVPDGKSIGKYELNTEKVFLYGDKKKISEITELVVEVNVADIKASSSVTVNIPKPEGVVSLSQNKVNVKVDFEKSTTKTIENVPVQSVNLSSGYSVQSAEGELLLNVELTGAASVINEINVDDILLEVDLADLSAGRHSVKVKVAVLDSRVGYKLSKEKVEVVIVKS